MKPAHLMIIALLFPIMASLAQAREVRELEWIDLLPESDIKALERLPETMEEMNRGLLDKGVDELTDDVQMPDVMRSTKVKAELEGEYIKLPGFLVPLDRKSDGTSTRFFLVPWFGACIHTPPPPPNQIVHITYEEGIVLRDMRIPYWVIGELKIEQHDTEAGLATYAINADEVSQFE